MKKRTPNKQYPRMARVNELLREVLAESLEKIDDERLAGVTITDVRCDADLAHALVHYDVFDAAVDDEVVEAFEELRPRLQSAINRETRLKGTPKLAFAADPVVRSAARIEDVLRGLNTIGEGPS